MHRLFLRVIGAAVLGVCLDVSANPAPGATPPPARNRQEVEAVLAQAPKAPPASELRPLRIVLVANRKDHGPEEHDYPLWMERWKVLLGGKEAGEGQVNLYGPASTQGGPPGAAKVKVQTAKDWPGPEQWARADLVVAFFGTGGIWNEAKIRDLKAFLDRGGGFVAVHSATIAEKPNARPLAELIGLAWEGGYTLFRHGRVDLKLTAPEHPICKGLPRQIRFVDETYWPLVGDASRIGLLATADERAKDSGRLRPEPMFWTYTAGKGRVYSTILGHYTWTFDDPYFRILLLRGMAWAAGESPYRFDPLALCGARVTDEKPADGSIPKAAPVAPDPQDENLLLWLDASDKSTLALAADDRVSAWANKAAKVGRKLTISGTQLPLYEAKALGGRPALRFDGVDDVLRDTAFGQSAQSWTLALVVTPRSNVGNGQFHALVATNRPGQDDFRTGLNLDLGAGATTQFDTLNLEGIKHQGGAGNLRTEFSPFGEGQIILLATDNERTRLWINGREEDSRTASNAVTIMDELRVGGRFYAGRERGYFDGDLSEVVLYKTSLTDAHRAALYAYLWEKYGSDIKPPVAHTIDEAWNYLPRYDWALSRRPLAPIDEAIRNARQDPQVYKALEPRLIEVLRNSASTLAAKDYACRRLAIAGSAASAGALAKLLGDEKSSNMACFALERIPDPAADDVLRQALGSLRGNLRLAVIQALGNRRSPKAVADLVRLLSDADPAARQAAVTALGKIGGPEAAQALTAALTSAPASARATLADNCLKCAEQFRTAGKQAEALAVYERLHAPNVSGTTRIAAARGMILVRGPAGVPLLFEQLAGDDPKGQAMALLLFREMPGTHVTEALVSRLSSLPPDRQARAIAALADRGDPAATPAVLAALKSGQPPVRFAAVEALGRLGDVSVVPVLLAAARGVPLLGTPSSAGTAGDSSPLLGVPSSGTQEAAFAQAAARSLVALSGKDIDAALLKALDASDAKTRHVAIEVLGRRAYAPATGALIAYARGTESTIRLAAVKALGETAAAADTPAIVGLLVHAKDASELVAAEAALVTIHARSDAKDVCAEAIAARLSQAQPAAKLTLLRTLRRMGGSKALEAVRTATGDSNPEVQDAAIRALCDWPNAEPADDLLKIARQSSNQSHRLLALRGYLRLASLDALSPQRRLAMAQESLRLIQRDEERRLVLGVLARVPDVDALATVLPFLDTESLKEEAGAAAVAIGEKVLSAHPVHVVEAMKKVLVSVRNQDVVRRAKELQTKAR